MDRIMQGWRQDLRQMLGALIGDRRGVVSPMVAALAVTLVGAVGVALDAGLYYTGNRALRTATEAAALAAAMDPGDADARARAYLESNGYPGSVLRTVEVGRYCADSAIAPGDRFDPSFARCPGTFANPANAVRLTTASPSRRFLTAVLGGANPIPELAARATAARIDEAGIEVTSGHITVTNRLVNAVNDLLGALLGIKLILSTAEIEALMGGNVDAGLFFDGLAESTGRTGTYGEVAAGTYGLEQIARAAADAAANPATAAALRTFGEQVGNGYQVPLAGLFGLGVWRNMPVGEADDTPALRAGINAYQLMAYAVQAGPGVLDASDLVSVAVPGSVVRVTAMSTGAADRPRFSFGPAGDTVAGTSMLRLRLELGLGNLRLLGQSVAVNSVPVLLDIAAGQARLTAIDCPGTAEQRRDTTVTVQASSGLVNAYIGEPPANAMSRPMPPISAADIRQARLVNVLGLVTVDARAIAQPVLGNTASVVLGPGGGGTIGSPSAPGTPAHVGNSSQVGPLLTTLTDSLAAPNGLQVKLLGLCLPLVCEANTAAVRQTVLGAVTDPLAGLVGSTADPVLDILLAALGIELGHATIWATGARCGVPVLV